MELEKKYKNVDGNVQINVDVPFKMALTDHEKRIKEAEDAFKANRKLADETVPKDPDTGKKVTSKDLKKMKLSEGIFNNVELEKYDYESFLDSIETLLESLDDLKTGVAVFDDTLELIAYDIGYRVKQNILNSLEDAIGEGSLSEDNVLDIKATFPDLLEESLNESFLDEVVKKVLGEEMIEVPDEDIIEDEYIEDSVPVEDELDTEMLDEGIEFDIAKNMLKKFNEGLMPKNWNPELYLEKIVNKNYITKAQADTLKEAFVGKK